RERVTGGPNGEGERRRDREAAQFSPQPVVKERWRLNLSLSCERWNGRETTSFIPHETIHLPDNIHRS
ncbi:hypothetical protein, partial [Dickeya solani]|uniref:hypothetical protein n=1 Tax=Dickeya solani TaxID=1089444 RepID=UPI001EE64CB5